MSRHFLQPVGDPERTFNIRQAYLSSLVEDPAALSFEEMLVADGYLPHDFTSNHNVHHRSALAAVAVNPQDALAAASLMAARGEFGGFVSVTETKQGFELSFDTNLAKVGRVDEGWFAPAIEWRRKNRLLETRWEDQLAIIAAHFYLRCSAEAGISDLYEHFFELGWLPMQHATHKAVLVTFYNWDITLPS